MIHMGNRGWSRALLAVVVAAVACTAVSAKSFRYAERKRQIKVANLLVDSAMQNPSQGISPDNLENPDPHVWYILNRSPLKPPGWEFVNPLAPSTVTEEIRRRWINRAGGGTDPGLAYFNVGDPITKNMGAYWEVRLTPENFDELVKYDMLFISNHRMTAFTDADRALLKRLIDAGGQVFVDDCWGMNIGRADDSSPPRFEFNYTQDQPASPGTRYPGIDWDGDDNPARQLRTSAAQGFAVTLQFHAGGASSGVAVIKDRQHPLLTNPYWLTQYECNNLGDKFVQSYRIVQYDWRTLFPVLNNGAYDTDTDPVWAPYGRPYLAAGKFGGGRIIVCAGDIGCKINDTVSGGLSYNGPSGLNSGIFCGNDFTNPDTNPRWRGDMYLMFNMLTWAEEWSSGRNTPRNTGSSREVLSESMAESERLQRETIVPLPADYTDAAEALNALVSSPTVTNGVIYVVAPPTANAPAVLLALDADPSRDMDRDNNPDDGLQGSALGIDWPAHDLLWYHEFDPGVVITTPPVTARVPMGGGTNGDIVIVGDHNGIVYAFEALPRSASGGIESDPARMAGGVPFGGWPGGVIDVGAPVVGGITVTRGYAYVPTVNSALHVLDVINGSDVAQWMPPNNPGAVAAPTVAIVEDRESGALDEVIYTQSGTNAAGTLYNYVALVFRTENEQMTLTSQNWDANSNGAFDSDETATWRIRGFASICGAAPYDSEIRVRADGRDVKNFTIGPNRKTVTISGADWPAGANSNPAAAKVVIDYYQGTGAALAPRAKWIYRYDAPSAVSPVATVDGKVVFSSVDGVVHLLDDFGYPQGYQGKVVFARSDADPLRAPADPVASEVAQRYLQYTFDTRGTIYTPPAVAGDAIVQTFVTVDGYTGVVCLETGADFTIDLGNPEGRTEIQSGQDSKPAPRSGPLRPDWQVHVFCALSGMEIPEWDAGADGQLGTADDIHNYSVNRAERTIRFYASPQFSGRRVLVQWIDNTTTPGNPRYYHEFHEIPQVVRWCYPSLSTATGFDIVRPYFDDGAVDANDVFEEQEMGNAIACFRDDNGNGSWDAGEVWVQPLYIDYDADVVGFSPANLGDDVCLVQGGSSVAGTVAAVDSGGQPIDALPSQASGSLPDASGTAPVIAGDKVFLSFNLVYDDDGDPATPDVADEFLAVFALDPRDSVYLDTVNEPWPGATWPWPDPRGGPSNAPIEPPWETYVYDDAKQRDPYLEYYDADGSLGMCNPNYDLLSVRKIGPASFELGSPLVAGGQLAKVSVEEDPRVWNLRVFEAEAVRTLVGDHGRILGLDSAGSPVIEVPAASFTEFQGTGTTPGQGVCRTKGVVRPRSIQALSTYRKNSFLVADPENDRVIEIDTSGNITWRCENIDLSGQGGGPEQAFLRDPNFVSLPQGEPWSLSRPTDAVRWEYEGVDPSDGTAYEFQMTTIADSGHSRVLCLVSKVPIGAASTTNEVQKYLYWVSDPNQVVLDEDGQTIIRAGEYTYISCRPIKYPNSGALFDFGGVVAGMNGYRLSTVPGDEPDPAAPDGSPLTRQLGEGASVVKLGRVGGSGPVPVTPQIEWAFSDLWVLPRDDTGAPTGEPPVRFKTLEHINHVDCWVTRDANDPSIAVYHLTIADDEGIYPVEYIPAVGAESGLVPDIAAGKGKAIIALPDTDLSDGYSYGAQWAFLARQDLENPLPGAETYVDLMAAMEAVGGSAYPVDYTGAGPNYFAYFRPVYVEYQRDGKYLVVNGHESKGEVLLLDPSAVGVSVAAMVAPQPSAYALAPGALEPRPYLGTRSSGATGLSSIPTSEASTYRFKQPLCATRDPVSQ